MSWLEISVQCDGEAAEAVSELFNRFNQGGAVIEMTGWDAVGELAQPVVTVRTYLPAGELGAERRLKIEQGLWFLSRLLPIPEPSFRELADEDWASAWRAHYRPTRVGQRLVIVPAWQVDEAVLAPGDLPVVLDPGMAFGTGLHPSTRLCMAALERHVQPGDAVLDVGCGSGVLSITAARLGAASILATDIDPVAVQATVENCQRNGVERVVRAQVGSLPDPALRPDGWQVVVANILAEVIVDLLAAGMAARLAPRGRLIMSGIIAERADAVTAALEQSGLRLCERTEEGDWVCLVAGL